MRYCNSSIAERVTIYIISMIIIALIIAFLSVFAYWKIILPASYWKRRGVKQGREIYIFGDNAGTIYRKFSFATLIEHNYSKFPKERYAGLYQFSKPILMLREPELIKQLAVKDFDFFTDHINMMPDEPVWSKNLFALKGQQWRDMRATLSPAFTSSKMRAMFSLINDCAAIFVGHLHKTSSELESFDTKDLFTRFTNDVIATCAFGIKCNSLEERENEFYVMGKEATNFSGTTKMIKFTLLMLSPKIFKYCGIRMFSQEVADFFQNLVVNSVKMREEQNIVRPDMIHLMMEARKGRLHHIEDNESAKEAGFATVEESEIGTTHNSMRQEITDADMTAQALIFFFAGFDTVSTLMCFMAQELAMNPEIQERLREEVDNALANCNGNMSYESLAKMEYMDMVMSETLRLWPVAVMTDRVCQKSYTIKAEKPGEVDVTMDKGDVLWIPVIGIHRDPEYFPNPCKFDPERFNADNRNNILPYTYLPFGVGPRNCIGSRFALMEVKTVFVHILSKFELEVVKKTQIPIEMSKKSFAMIPENGFWLGLKKRNI